MRRVLAAALALLATAGLGCGDSDEATAKAPPTFYGVAPQDAVSEADLARMGNGNVGSYHLLLSWARIEQTEDNYDWSSYDVLMSDLAVQGIEPVAYVFGTPPWLANSGVVPPVRSPEALAAYSEFLTEAAERYGPEGSYWDTFALTHPGIEPEPIRIWEIWNEINSPNFWKPRPDPGEYAKLFRLSSKTLHRADPEAEVMIAGMFATPQSNKALTSFEYLKRLYEKPGVAEASDLVGIHPYGPKVSDVKKQMEKTLKVVRRGGDGSAGTWVTEIGWGSDPKVRSQLSKTPKKQGALLRKTYEMMAAKRGRWNLNGALWYTWRDADDPTALVCGWCGSAGLVDEDLDAKPAWEQFTKLTGGDPG